MKRILSITFVLQMLLSSVCMAFEPPTDKRWFWVGSTDKMGCWVDMESMEYRISDEYSHKKHKQVDVWVLFYDSGEDTSSKNRCTYDLTCNKFKLNSFIIYDKQGNVINSLNSSYSEFESVAPQTWAEAIFKICKISWEDDSRNQFK